MLGPVPDLETLLLLISNKYCTLGQSFVDITSLLFATVAIGLLLFFHILAHLVCYREFQLHQSLYLLDN